MTEERMAEEPMTEEMVSGEPMTEEPMADEVFDSGADAPVTPSAPKSRRVDLVSLMAGLLFIAIALAALIDRFWVDVDSALMVGAVIAAVGVAMAVGVARRAVLRRD